MIDLTGGELKVIGNKDDKHICRLNNPGSETIIETAGEYQADFITPDGHKSAVSVDISDVSTGVLKFDLIVKDGFYRIRRLNPQRTLLTVEVESR